MSYQYKKELHDLLPPCLTISPELTPSLTLLSYSPYFVKYSDPLTGFIANDNPTEAIIKHLIQDKDLPTTLMLLVEAYPYPKDLVNTVLESANRNGVDRDPNSIQHYPEHGFMRVHYLFSTISRSRHLNLPDNLYSSEDLNKFLSKYGLGSQFQAGYVTEAFTSIDSFKNIQANLNSARRDDGLDNLLLLASYSPRQTGFSTIKTLYQSHLLNITGKYTLNKPFLFTSNPHHTTAPSSEIVADLANDQPRFCSLINSSIGDLVQTADYSSGFQQIFQSTYERQNTFKENTESEANKVVTQIHLSEETLFPTSLSHCMYFSMINNIKDFSPFKDQIRMIQEEENKILEKIHDNIVRVLETKEKIKQPLTAISDSAPVGNAKHLYDTKLTDWAAVYTSAKKLKKAMDGTAPTSWKSLGSSLSTQTNTLNLFGNLSIIIPSLLPAISLYELKDITDERQRYIIATKALSSIIKTAAGAVKVAALWSSHAASALGTVTIVASMATSVLSVIQKGLELRDINNHLKDYAKVVLPISEALSLIVDRGVVIKDQYGQEISQGLYNLLLSDFKELKIITDFIIDRYKLLKFRAEADLAFEASMAALVLIGGAVGLATCGTVAAATTLVAGVSKALYSTAKAADKLARYHDKTKEFIQFYDRSLSQAHSGAPQEKGIFSRTVKLLDWASETNTNLIKAKTTRLFHSTLTQTSGALTGATLDDYRRVQLATFRISAVVRYKTTPAIQDDAVVKAYVAIAELLGKAMDSKEKDLKALIEQQHFVPTAMVDHSLSATTGAYDTEYKRLVIKAAKKIK